MLDLVISRHQEDLNWTNYLPVKANILVYDTSDKPWPGSIKTPNYGAEGAGFLTYVMSRYDRLADVTVFTQGRHFDHCEKTPFARGLVLAQNAKAFMPLGDPHEWTFQTPCCREWLLEYMFPRSPRINYSRHGCISDPDRLAAFQEFYIALFDQEKPPERWVYAWGSICAVPRDKILARPLCFYAKLAGLLEHHTRPFEAVLMERLWPVVWR